MKILLQKPFDPDLGHLNRPALVRNVTRLDQNGLENGQVRRIGKRKRRQDVAELRHDLTVSGHVSGQDQDGDVFGQAVDGALGEVLQKVRLEDDSNALVFVVVFQRRLVVVLLGQIGSGIDLISVNKIVKT